QCEHKAARWGSFFYSREPKNRLRRSAAKGRARRTALRRLVRAERSSLSAMQRQSSRLEMSAPEAAGRDRRLGVNLSHWTTALGNVVTRPVGSGKLGNGSQR